MVKNYSIIAALSLIMLIALIYGIAESGSPWDTRGKRFDQTRISDLNSLKSAIDSYYSLNSKLPTTLDDLSSNNSYSYYKNTDPETSQPYDYKVLGTTSYQLCATFSQKSDSQNRYGGNYYLPPLNSQISDHPKGYYCFNLFVSPSVLYKPPTTYPSNATASNRDAIRISDLNRLKQMITDGSKKFASPGASFYCGQTETKQYPCSGQSHSHGNSAKVDVNGQVTSRSIISWMKADLTSANDKIIPEDPINDSKYHYTYCATKDGWEIDAVLESPDNLILMKGDAGDDDTKYEIGTNLTLIDKIPECKF